MVPRNCADRLSQLRHLISVSSNVPLEDFISIKSHGVLIQSNDEVDLLADDDWLAVDLKPMAAVLAVPSPQRAVKKRSVESHAKGDDGAEGGMQIDELDDVPEGTTDAVHHVNEEVGLSVGAFLQPAKRVKFSAPAAAALA